MFSLAHLSDLHATPVEPQGLRPLLNKRLLGWLSWRSKRREVYRTDVLEALLDDLARQAPDQIAVTGDLTNVALESEFAAARGWLERLGGAARVSLVPGNHDAYVRVPRAAGWDLWSEFMRSDRNPPGGERAAAPVAGGDGLPDFPALRVRGPAALVGVCTAIPTAPFRATGAVGAEQLARLDRLLAKLADASWCRIVLIHHPPVAGLVTRRRALCDAAALRDVLRRRGADLVLHGHTHRASVAAVDGPEGPIPVVGVPSSSNVGRNPAKRSRYHLYAVEPEPGPGSRFRIALRTRGYDPATGRFADEGEIVL